MNECTPEEQAELERLERHIGTGDYSVRSINGRGHLEICLCLQGWSGERGWRLFLRCLARLTSSFNGGLWATWILRDGGKGREI